MSSVPHPPISPTSQAHPPTKVRLPMNSGITVNLLFHTSVKSDVAHLHSSQLITLKSFIVLFRAHSLVTLPTQRLTASGIILLTISLIPTMFLSLKSASPNQLLKFNPLKNQPCHHFLHQHLSFQLHRHLTLKHRYHQLIKHHHHQSLKHCHRQYFKNHHHQSLKHRHQQYLKHHHRHSFKYRHHQYFKNRHHQFLKHCHHQYLKHRHQHSFKYHH